MLEIKSMPKPENKEQMIEYLTNRLNAAQIAIEKSEGVIQHERDNRKEISQDLKQRNEALRCLIENQKNLTDRINTELETTLEMAVREKFQTSQHLNAKQAELRQKKAQLEKVAGFNKSLK